MDENLDFLESFKALGEMSIVAGNNLGGIRPGFLEGLNEFGGNTEKEDPFQSSIDYGGGNVSILCKYIALDAQV